MTNWYMWIKTLINYSKNDRTMYKTKRIIKLFSVVVFGLTLAITGGIIPVSISAQQQQQNSTSNQSMMIELAKQNLTSPVAVNMTTETNETTTNIKNVSIVPEATGLEDKAYQPNPIKIKVGETITWINNDISIHTVTEGNRSTINVSVNGFDSGLISPEETFQHAFDKVEIIQYHCALHPTMLGMIIVVV
jgi:plastocyanin